MVLQTTSHACHVETWRQRQLFTSLQSGISGIENSQLTNWGLQGTKRKISCPRHLHSVKMATVERDILPDTIKPSNYALSLYDMELGGKFSYQGTVSVTVKIIRSTKEITLNAVQLQLHSAEVQIDSAKTQTATTSTSVTYDEKKQRATISFPEEIPACENALIIIKFAGTINQ